MKDNRKMFQIISVIALCVAVLGISIGFAAMQASLSISGQAKVVPASWGVEFTAKTFSDNSTDAEEGSTPPTFNATTFSGYEIVLTKPGDKGTYEVTVENTGDIDAKVSTVTLGSSLSYAGASGDVAIVTGHINYNVTWLDGTAIAANDELPKHSSKKIKVEVEYDPEATQLPSGPVTITGKDLTVLFVQK